MSTTEYLAVVSFGGTDDHGLLVRTGKDLAARWPDGHADTVYRDRRGWFWDEYGDTPYPVGRRAHVDTGTRLHVVSRRRADVEAMAQRVSL